MHAEQVRILFAGLWLPAVSAVLVAVLLVASLWSVVDHRQMLIWLTAVVLVTLARLGLAWRFRRKAPSGDAASRWALGYAIGSTAAGLLWGACGLWLFPVSDLQHQVILVMALAGIASGGAVTMAPVWPVAAAFLIPTLLPLSLHYLWLGGPVALIVATMVGLFLVFTLIVSRRWNRVLHDNLRLQAEGEAREQALRESESRYHTIFQASPLGMLHFDARGRVTDCNDKLLQITGETRERFLGFDMLESVQSARVKRAVQRALSRGEGYFEGDYSMLVASGPALPVRILFSGVRDSQGAIMAGVAVVEDLSERRQAEETIHRQAYYDALTGLPNRRLLSERLAQIMADSAQHGEHGAVLFIDLDRFKEVNESLGHSVGDRLLNATARRLTDLLREGDIAARVNSDEFIVVVGRIRGDREQVIERVNGVAERVMSALSEPYHLSERPLLVTPSIGFALFSEEENSAVELLKQAETAMFQAKTEGRAKACGYLPSMQTAAVWRLTLEQDLRQALDGDQLQLHYQPQVDGDGRIVGAEALLRWAHPERGMVPPFEFIPVAEESGLILDIGQRVLEQACQTLQRLDARQLPRLAINISPRQFGQPDFAASIERCIERSGIDPWRLQLEITEGVMIDNLIETIETMRDLKRIGVSLAIDDFGVGYSSLSYLKRLPLDELKIDRSFIQELDNSNDEAIVQTIITIARNLRLAVVAEGVETASQRDFLLRNGCHIFQGYWFFRPLPFDALVAALGECSNTAGAAPR
ncbi:putative bifunctional diguanylate cyclase/phosphodiesterase [Modicisalibacter radicis]|uniref:putative bifunctional diguanylate cyclase/phosphodiesterase n=1 Tax=Halomonas sp. EAR18 TaxID=2518972 RepID=UPI001FCEE39E|nr:EAL domain-containing protein [Halomonas sp. EAR18]